MTCSPTAMIHEDVKRFGLGFHSLKVECHQKMIQSLLNSLNAPGTLGKITKELLHTQIKVLNGTVVDAQHQDMRYYSLARKWAVINEAGLEIRLNDTVVLQEDNQKFMHTIRKLKEMEDLDTKHVGEIMHHLHTLHNLGVTQVAELINHEQTHFISAADLKLMYKGVNPKHIRALHTLTHLCHTGSTPTSKQLTLSSIPYPLREIVTYKRCLNIEEARSPTYTTDKTGRYTKDVIMLLQKAAAARVTMQTLTTAENHGLETLEDGDDDNSAPSTKRTKRTPAPLPEAAAAILATTGIPQEMQECTKPSSSPPRSSISTANAQRGSKRTALAAEPDAEARKETNNYREADHRQDPTTLIGLRRSKRIKAQQTTVAPANSTKDSAAVPTRRTTKRRVRARPTRPMLCRQHPDSHSLPQQTREACTIPSTNRIRKEELMKIMKRASHHIAPVYHSLFSHKDIIRNVLWGQRVTDKEKRWSKHTTNKAHKIRSQTSQTQFMVEWEDTILEDWGVEMAIELGYKVLEANDYDPKRVLEHGSDAEIAELETQLDCEHCLQTDTEEGNDMILCDICMGMFHQRCLSPPLADIPDTPTWICPHCTKDMIHGKTPAPKKYKKIKWHPSAEPLETLTSAGQEDRAREILEKARLPNTKEGIRAHLTNLQQQGIQLDEVQWELNPGDPCLQNLQLDTTATNPHLDTSPTGSYNIQLRKVDVPTMSNEDKVTGIMARDLACVYDPLGKCIDTMAPD